MKRLFALGCMALLLSGCSLTKPVVSEEFRQVAASHQRVAILPMTAHFNDGYKELMAFRSRRTNSAAYWLDLQRFAGLQMQKSLFTAMARQINRGKMQLAIQDFQITNQLLEQNKIPYSAIFHADKSALARLLGVDAVLWGITDVVFNPMGFQSGGVETTLFIYDARTGRQVWQQEVSQHPNTTRTSPEQLVGNSLNDLARLLPYRGLVR